MKKRKLKSALADAIVIKEHLQETKIKGFVMAPSDTTSLRLCEGTVLKVGDRVTRVVPGDLVIFGKHATSLLNERYGENLSIIRESNVMCTLEDIEEEGEE